MSFKEFYRRKKSEGLVHPTVIFVLLNLIVFSILGGFAAHASSGAAVYEQAYSKQIALMIDNAQPGMQIIFNFEKPIAIAEENNLKKREIIGIDNEKKEVVVRMSGKGGYISRFFSDYDVKYYFSKNNLVIFIGQ